MRRNFSVPVLDDPCHADCPFTIYGEPKTNGNGKPILSFLVRSWEEPNSVSLKTIQDAEREVAKRIKKALESSLYETRLKLKELEDTLTKLNQEGISGFEV